MNRPNSAVPSTAPVSAVPAPRLMTVHKDGAPCYDIVYSLDLSELTRAIVNSEFSKKRLCVVTDTNVISLWGEQVLRALKPLSEDGNSSGKEPMIYAIPAGEENKTLGNVQEIYRFLIENHFDRQSCLIALGGGVVGDMTGYTAATYLRGIDFIQVPTTLLAQADSSIGGKTGVDFDGYKNMVGAFYMPRLVFADAEFLKTLDERQFSSGFAEIMKHGLIRDKEYYSWLLEHRYGIMARDTKILTDMLVRSNEIKRDVVENDPYEKGERMLLNFGHTIGHAIEKASDFTMTHGECVCLGCIAAAYISMQRGYLDAKAYEQIKNGFLPFGLKIATSIPDPEKILRLTKSDKKVASGKLRFILLRDIGEAFIDTSVTDEEILAALTAITDPAV